MRIIGGLILMVLVLWIVARIAMLMILVMVMAIAQRQQRRASERRRTPLPPELTAPAKPSTEPLELRPKNVWNHPRD